jgi:DNA-binding transcriptional ArsR family regulator
MLYYPGMARRTAVLDTDALARVGLALADDSRRRILVALMDGPAYPAALAEDLDLTRSNVSNHLSCLRGCGLVTATPEGRNVRYELAAPALGDALRALAALALPEGCPHDAGR